MQVSLETTSGIERKLTITIPGTDIDGEVNKRLQNLSRRVRLDGFRPGKIPMKVIKRRYGASTRQDVLGEMMQSSFIEAVQEQKLNPAGMPFIEPLSDSDNDEDFTFVATFEVFPEIVLNDFGGISVERPVAEVQESDVDEMIETLRKQCITLKTLSVLQSWVIALLLTMLVPKTGKLSKVVVQKILLWNWALVA